MINLSKLFFLFIFCFQFLGFGAFGQSNGFEVLKNLEIMDQIYEHLDLYFVDEPQNGKLSKTSIDAMLKELDPYTVYYHESNIEDYRLMTTGQYGGVGALIRRMGDDTYFSEPYEGNPAEKAGIKAGDKIISIDGKDMHKKNSDDVSSALKGPKGTTIKVEIERQGEGKKTIDITRDEIKIPDVPYSGMLENKTGYVKLNSFTQTAASDVKAAIEKMKGEGMENLILDLRGNGGGLLIEAVKIVNFFVPKNTVVVTTKGRVKEENRVYKTLEDPIAENVKLVVLIDDGSASASEIVAGSLQDLDRAVIVGQTSFGKGLVQRTYDLKYGSKIKITIAKYYTPSGRCVQRLEYYDKENGAKPKEVPDSLLKTFQTRNGRKVIDGRGIEPDVDIELQDLSRLSAMLLTGNHIFNFATDYAFKHKTIAPAGEFKLTDAEYAEFKTYVLAREFKYNTASEEMLKKVKETAEKEGYFEDVKADYEVMLAKLTPSKDRDLDKFKEEVSEMLENEIVSRYYFQKGRTLDSFRYDKTLNKGKSILSNLSEYNTILKK
ncbi:MAG: S41 family peptidase [Crocinitomicaceae bacterium]|nr:S41 family peptidase [Crocinitomicaceae bacterium]